MVDAAVTQEINWTNHITEGDVLGISEASTTQYTQYLADLRLRAIGLDPVYGVTKSPYKHLEGIADVGAAGATKANFFEAQTTSYNMSSSIDGWNF